MVRNMEKSLVLEAVRQSIRDNINQDDQSMLVKESIDAFSHQLILESVAVNPALVKGVGKTISILLEKGDSRIMAFTNGYNHEYFDTNTGERQVFNSKPELMNFVRLKKSEGYKVVKNKSAIVKFLRKSLLAISSYIRKYGLLTVVGIGIAAVMIYFVGPMAVPFLGNVAMKLGLSGVGSGGESVDISGEGWIMPDISSTVSSSIDLDDLTQQASELDSEISSIVDAMKGDINPETRNILASELTTALTRRDELSGMIDVVGSNVSSVAAAATTVTTTNFNAIQSQINGIVDAMKGDITPEARNVLSNELQKLINKQTSM
jgi:hypothetical protein